MAVMKTVDENTTFLKLEKTNLGQEPYNCFLNMFSAEKLDDGPKQMTTSLAAHLGN
jgi:hypothetical protein